MLYNLGGKIKTPLQCLEHNVWFTESQIKSEVASRWVVAKTG